MKTTLTIVLLCIMSLLSVSCDEVHESDLKYINTIEIKNKKYDIYLISQFNAYASTDYICVPSSDTLDTTK